MMPLIYPVWSAPKNVHVVSTTRLGGSSEVPYSSFNVGTHVGDKLTDVMNNRHKLIELAQLPSEPVWLNQTHSTTVITLPLSASDRNDSPSADASFTNKANQICVVMTADCLPIVICDRNGTEVAAVHAGWRGLLDGILEKSVAQFSSHNLMAWCGPAIGAEAFEVGDEVKSLFCSDDQAADKAFIASHNPGKWFADLALLATMRLNQVGVNNIYYSNRCTYSESEQFFSYRKEGKTGRQATLIWFD